MTNTSEQHRQIKVSVRSDIAIAFKNACAQRDTSMAAVLSQSMADYTNTKNLAGTAGTPDYSERRRRRSAVRGIIAHLEQMKAWEERVRDNMPENLQGSRSYDAAEEAISSLEEAIDSLAGFWMVP